VLRPGSFPIAGTAPEIPFPADAREPRQAVRGRSGRWILPDGNGAQGCRHYGVDQVHEVAEGALQVQGFGGGGAGGLDCAGVFVPQGVKAGGGMVSIVNLLGNMTFARTDPFLRRCYYHPPSEVNKIIQSH
jgi:hypothetical protein